MCCLPNQFPLPIFLILNLKNISNVNPGVNYENIKEISEDNMFFNLFVISLNDNSDNFNENEDKNDIKNYIEKSDKPFYELMDLLMKFKDIKDNILLEYSKGISKKNKNTANNKISNNKDNTKDKKNCSIL
jgi:hypothetical protein